MSELSLYKHDFHAKCENDHKRNFRYIDFSKNKIKRVKEYCHVCEKRIEFIVVRYFKEIEKATELEINGGTR